MRNPAAWLAGVLFALGVAGFTGSSGQIVAKHDPLLTESERPRREPFGFSRAIRSDEWAVDLPMDRAQQLARPSFPLANERVGLGQITRFGFPALDWGTAFRPLTWPQLFGGRWGHGVSWFARSALLLLGMVAWFRAHARRRDGGADARGDGGVVLLAAIAVLFSSGMTWWMSSPIPALVAFCGLAVGAAARHAGATSWRLRALWLAAFWYLTACAFFDFFYPPVWAPMLWLVAGSVLDLHWRPPRTAVAAVGASAPLIALMGASVALSILYYAPYLALVADTVYPGRRVAVPGGMPLSRFLDLLWPSLQGIAPLRGPEQYLGKVPGNVCEASAVEVLPLAVLLVLGVIDGPVRAAMGRVIAAQRASLLAAAVLLAWLLLPLPEAFGWPTLLRWSPWNRVWIPFGVACAVFATSVLSELHASGGASPAHRRRATALAVAVLATSWLLARQHVVSVPPELWSRVLLTAALTVAAVASLGRKRAAPLLAAAWALPLVVADVAVNPLARSQAMLVKGSGHAVVEAALAETPGRLLEYEGHPGSVLAGFGWPVLAAVYVAPDNGLFTYLRGDVPELREEVHNRYAHVSFGLPGDATRILGGDAFRIAISPCSPRLATLAVNHFLVQPGNEIPAECRDALAVRAAGAMQLWSRRDPAGEFGVAVGVPKTALDFDFSARGGGSRARRVPSRTGFVVEVPAEPAASYALATNLSLVEGASCTDATARVVDTHVVVTPSGAHPRCEFTYVDSVGALGRLSGQAADSARLVPAGAALPKSAPAAAP
jgi:hypothetical protein